MWCKCCRTKIARASAALPPFAVISGWAACNGNAMADGLLRLESNIPFALRFQKKTHNNLASRVTIKLLLWRVLDLDRNDDWLDRTRINEKELKFIELCSIKEITSFLLLSHWQLWQEVVDDFGNFSCCDVGQILSSW